MLAKQELYFLRHSYSPFSLVILEMEFPQLFAWNCSQTVTLLNSASKSAVITGVSHLHPVP
jgi:hypothetical protein